MKKKVILASVLSIGLLGGITTLAHADETWYCDNHHEGYATCGGSMQDAIHHEEQYNNGVHHDETDDTYNSTSTHHSETHENTEHHEEQCNNSGAHHDETDETYNGNYAHHSEAHGNTEHSHGSHHH